MHWSNEPTTWRADNDTITVTTDPKTDFWRKTHYGFIRDNGHFYYRPVRGDFTATVSFSGRYTAQYDQAGLMIRLDEANWLKCGIEYVDGTQQASVVVTRDYSDWSVAPLEPAPTKLWLRLTRQGEAVEVSYSLDGQTYVMIRVAYLPLADVVEVGVMCASPEGDGFTVTFKDLMIENG
jgi:regulation of enolase protein 1 (concanavalin A-like superfamily)